MKPDPYQLIEAALEPGETLLWTGRPHRGFKFSKSLFFLIPFFLIWGGIPTSVIVGNLFSGDFSPGMVFLFVFPVVTILFFSNMFIFDVLQSKRTYYALSDRHALIVSGYRHPEIRTVWLGNIDSLEIKPNDRGHGSIKCYAPLEPPFGKINKKGEVRLKPLFRGVADVYAVRDLLEREVDTQRAARVRDDVVNRNLAKVGYEQKIVVGLLQSE